MLPSAAWAVASPASASAYHCSRAARKSPFSYAARPAAKSASTGALLAISAKASAIGIHACTMRLMAPFSTEKSEFDEEISTAFSELRLLQCPRMRIANAIQSPINSVMSLEPDENLATRLNVEATPNPNSARRRCPRLPLHATNRHNNARENSPVLVLSEIEATSGKQRADILGGGHVALNYMRGLRASISPNSL